MTQRGHNISGLVSQADESTDGQEGQVAKAAFLLPRRLGAAGRCHIGGPDHTCIQTVPSAFILKPSSLSMVATDQAFNLSYKVTGLIRDI